MVGVDRDVHALDRNDDPLDCRRENLVVRTVRQRTRNMRKATSIKGRPPTSRFKGVYWHGTTKRWQARIRVNGKDRLLGRFGDEIAAVITEAAPGNMGVVPPGTEDGTGFNAFLAAIARAHGALFISDEVMTGFRVSRSGQFGLDGVRPDLMTFGKVMGGGFPAAAFGGNANLMQHLAPVGGVYQAGTLSGNPIATAAGLATLRLATREIYEQVDRTAASLRAEIGTALQAAGIPYVIQNAGNLFSVFFVTEDVTAVPDYATAGRQSTSAYAAFFHSMLSSGVYLPPSGYEAWFLSAAHDDRAMSRIVEALPAAARAAASAWE